MLYLDYAATTPLHSEVLKSYQDLLSTYFYNADSIYDKGIQVYTLMEKSRQVISELMGVSSQEIIFTSCGSEANNLAIKGACMQYQNRGKHIITTCVEHSSVYETCKQLESVYGFEVTYLPVNQYGCINIEDLKNAIRKDTILVSIMYVNNELGSINPISNIATLLKEYPFIKFHVDMVQALAKIDIDLTDVDLASFSAHKIHGLKGSGFLYKNKKTTLVPLLSGGQQEFGLRGGTSNACTNIILAKTLRLALTSATKDRETIKRCNQYARLELNKIEGVVISSHEDYCSPAILNFSCIGYKPEVMLHALESKGVYVSTRSACSSKSMQVSRVMAALNIDSSIAGSALRISFDGSINEDQINEFIYCLKEAMATIKKQR